MDYFLVSLRAIHVLSGVFWAGTAIFFALYIVPAANRLGPAAGPFMQAITAPRQLPLAMSVTALLTTLSGLLLFWRLAGVHILSFVQTPFGFTLLLGAIAALIAFSIGLLVSKPSAMRSAALLETIAERGTPPNSDEQRELAGLRQRLRVAANVNAVLLGTAAMLMGVARYI